MSSPILLIEDDPDIQQSLKILLGIEGYAINSVNNGLEGLAYLRSGKPVSVILLDLMMPVMDGYEFLTAFHREKFSDIPIVLLSAASNLEQTAHDHALPYVKKPIDIDLLLANLEDRAVKA